MAAPIKIGADINSIKRSIFEISKTIDQQLGRKRGFELFDKETRDFLSKQAGTAIADLQKRMEELGKESKSYHESLKLATKTEEETLRIKTELLRVEKERVRVQRDINSLQEAQQTFSGEAQLPGAPGQAPGKGMPGLPKKGGKMGRLMELLHRVPLLGSGLGILSRMGPLGLAGAGLIGAGGFAVTRAMGGFNAYESSVNDRLALRARGIRNVTGRSMALQRLGFDPNEVRESQMQSLDIFGTRGSQLGEGSRQGGVPGQNDLQRRMEFARFAGVDTNRLQGTFAGTQASAGFNAANRAFEEFRSSILANKIEEAIGPYLEATASLLQEINQDGLALTAPAIQALAAIAGNGEKVSQQQAAKIIGSIDRAIKGSQGDVRAFYMEAFASQGIGGGVMGGAEEAANLGLFGGSEQRLKDLQESGLMDSRSIKAYQQMGLLGNPQAKAQGIVALFNKLSSQLPEGPQKELFKAQIAQRLTGAESGLEGLMRMGAIKKMATAASPEEMRKAQEEAEKQFMDPEARFRSKIEDLLSSPEGGLKKIAAETEASRQILGEKIAPVMMDLRRFTIALDKTLGSALKLLGVQTDEEKAVEGLLDSPDFKSGLRGDTPEMLQDKIRAAQERIKENNEYLNEQRKEGISELGLKMSPSGVENEKLLEAIKYMSELLERQINQNEKTQNILRDKGGPIGRSPTTGGSSPRGF